MRFSHFLLYGASAIRPVPFEDSLMSTCWCVSRIEIAWTTPSQACGRGPWTVRVAPAPSSAGADEAHAARGRSSDSQPSVGQPGDPDRSGESAAACPVRFRARLPSGACAREVQRPIARRLATRLLDAW